MNVKRALQWAILAVLAAASALNILYLTGVIGQHAATWGFLLVVGCFALTLLLKKRMADAPAPEDNALQRARGIATAVFAVIWLVTGGMAFVWMK